MKVYCDGIELSDALSKVGKALPIKNVVPIFEGIKLKAAGDTLTITASDGDLSIEKKIKASVKIEGETVAPGKFLIEYIKKIENEAIELDATKEDILYIRYGNNGQNSIKTLAADEYPPFKYIDGAAKFSIISKELKDLINKIIFNTSQEDTRPVLKGCCLDLEGNGVTGVASDGYRMAICKKQVIYSGKDIKVIIPARSMSEISKLAEEDDKNIEFNIDKNHIMVDIADTKIVSTLINSEYINYKKIVPLDFTTKLIVDKKQLEACLDRAFYVTKSDKKSIVKLETKESVLNITAESEISNLFESLSVSLDGKDLTIGFNAKFLMDCMRSISDSFVKLCFTTSTAPGIIVPVGDDETFLYLILPVRIIN